MSWWNGKSNEPQVTTLYESPGSIVAVDDPKDSPVVPLCLGTPEKPKDPKPDLATKPKDVIGYCFGYVCPKKHVHAPFEAITTDGYKERRACPECGGVAKPGVVKRTAGG